MARIYYICQILASLYLTLFGAAYAVRSAIEKQSAIVVVAFAAVAYFGCQLTKISVKEYKDYRP